MWLAAVPRTKSKCGASKWLGNSSALSTEAGDIVTLQSRGTKGRFVKGGFGECARSGFWYRRSVFCTLGSGMSRTPGGVQKVCAKKVRRILRSLPKCTTVAAIQLRMRMRILTRPKNSLAIFCDQISTRSCELSIAKEFAGEC